MNEPNETAIALALAQDSILEFAMRYLRDHGFDFPKDGNAASEWCQTQAKLGIADAQAVYGVLQNFGLFRSDDFDAGRFWIQSAADEGHPTALLMLAGFVEAGSNSEAPDAQRAFALVRSLAETGYGPALVQMGVMYGAGINTEKDRDRSLDCFRKAAESNDAHGQYFLGTSLIEEMNAEAVEEGTRWLKLAASTDHAGAHRILGYLYSDGSKGLEQDEEKSRYHFLAAAQIEDAACADFRISDCL